ncbi:MAG TPA: EamA family transporter [Afifellaceae bacterium]|nr:EamA family transporter [Afifellaceae bacterium]
MESIVFALVLGGAAMHAAWNAVVKGSGDPLIAIALVTAGSGSAALLLLPFIGWQVAPEAWIWIAGSALAHILYRLALVRGYAIGDMSLVYPIARGSAPLLTALVGITLFSEPVSRLAFAGILVIVAGVFAISMVRGSPAMAKNSAAVGFALLTAALITTYTYLDGFGARVSGNAAAYTVLLFVVDTPIMLVIAIWRRGIDGVVAAFQRSWIFSFGGGILSFLSYWIAIWAMTLVPIPLVAALRETSIAFGALIAVIFLGERVTPARMAATVAILAGAALLRFA